MILLTWNIRHGGGTRLARIIEEIAAYDADVIALTEYRAGSGKDLCAAFRDRGWPYAQTTNPAGNENGIAVLSRTLLVRHPCPAASEHQARWLDVDLEHGFGLAVLHIMAAGSSKTHPFERGQGAFLGRGAQGGRGPTARTLPLGRRLEHRRAPDRRIG